MVDLQAQGADLSCLRSYMPVDSFGLLFLFCRGLSGKWPWFDVPSANQMLSAELPNNTYGTPTSDSGWGLYCQHTPIQHAVSHQTCPKDLSQPIFPNSSYEPDISDWLKSSGVSGNAAQKFGRSILGDPEVWLQQLALWPLQSSSPLCNAKIIFNRNPMERACQGFFPKYASLSAGWAMLDSQLAVCFHSLGSCRWLATQLIF